MIKAQRIVPFLLLLVLLGVPARGELPAEAIRLVSFSSHSRLIFNIDEGIPVEWKSSSQGFKLLLKGIALMDLGAVLGEESQWKSRYQGISDVRLDGLQFEEVPGGVQVSGKWKYPKGKLALAHPDMEYFDYREKNPGRYVIDFWMKDGPTVAEINEAERRKQIIQSVRQTQEQEKKRMDRRLASIKRRKEASEKSRQFCQEPLSEKNDIFLEFLPIHQSVDFSRWFSGTTADVDFHYYRPKKKNREAQYVRLAIDLYYRGNTALALRTLEFFDQEFPKSDYQAEMRFLKANVLFKFGFIDEGDKILSQLMTDEKDAPATLHAVTFLARRLMEKNLWLDASEKFLWLIRNYPDYHLNWVFHLGLAESFYAIRQVEQAAKEYRWVIDHGPNSAAKAEAAIRVGDLYLNRFQYEQALGAYSIGYRYFASDLKSFPTYYLNWGETLYQLKQFEKAKSVFENFLNSFGNHPGGWRAAYRLGEIAARTSKNGLSSEGAQSWFHQAINRYPYTPGATLARLRLLPCGQHGGFDLETQQRFFENEAKNFDASKEVWTKSYDDLRALSRIRAVIALGNEDLITSTAVEEYRIAKAPYVKNLLASVAHENFRKTILSMLAEGKKFEALSTYSAKFSKLPDPEPENTYDFVLQLSRAASDLGFGELAQDLHETYENFEQKTKKAATRSLASSHKGSEEETQDLEEQLKLSEKSFTEAKGKWIATQGKDSASRESIQSLLGHVLDESTYAYEKELILALLEQKEKNLKSALYHVSKAQLLNSNVRVEAWLAQLESQVGDSALALKLFKKLESKIEAARSVPSGVEDILGVPTLPTLESIWITEAEIYERSKAWGEAAGTYSKLMEKGLGGGRVQYQYAKSLLNTGGIREKSKAREVLEALADQPSKVGSDEFWKKLASETLATMPRRGKNE